MWGKQLQTTTVHHTNDIQTQTPAKDMDEPPAKRSRRVDPSINDRTSPFPSSSGKAGRQENRDSARGSQRDEERRKRSRSRELYDARERKRQRSRSREREAALRDREGDRNKQRDNGHDGRDREANGPSRRNRSRSPERTRLNRDERPRRRSRSRSRSPLRNGNGTPARARSPAKRLDHGRPRIRDKPKAEEDKDRPKSRLDPDKSMANGDAMQLDAGDDDGYLKRMMGFTAFKSTHNTKVPGNQIYGVRKEKKTEYRQYMNRVGGFNRPLSPGR